MPEISVIIPTYNRAAVICGAIDSVLAQTFRDFELLVVDDGSTDATGDILKRYRGRVRYLHTENQGRSVARNLGIMLAEGRLCAFLDSDDLWFPEKLERQVGELRRRPGLGLLHGPVEVIDEDGHPMAGVTRDFRAGLARQQAGGETYEELLLDHTMYTSTTMIPRSVFDEVGLFDPELDPREDLDLYLRIALAYPIGSLSGAPLCKYRIRKDELTNPPNLSSVYIKVHSKHLRMLHDAATIPNIRMRKAIGNVRIALARDHYAHGDRRTAGSHLLKALTSDPAGISTNPAFLWTASLVLTPPPMLDRLRRVKARATGAGAVGHIGKGPETEESVCTR
jgi:glycosyltransferase involved in cell wall biosynthesis